MQHLTFSIDADSTRQAEIIREIATWPGVSAASMLQPGARSAAVRQMAWLEAHPDAIPTVLARLREIHEVRHAGPPPLRRLAD